MVTEYREVLQEQGKHTWSFPPNLLWNINSTEHWTYWFSSWDKKQTSQPLSELYTSQQKRKAQNSCLCSNPGNLSPRLQFRLSSFLVLDCHIMNLCKIRTISGFQQNTKENRKISGCILYRVWYLCKGTQNISGKRAAWLQYGGQMKNTDNFPEVRRKHAVLNNLIIKLKKKIPL